MKVPIRLAVVLGAVVAMFTAGAITTTLTASAASEAGPFRVFNYNSGLCLDVLNAGKSDGTVIEQYRCNGTAAQEWHFIYQASGGKFLIVPHHTYTDNPQGCVTMPNWSTVAGEDAKIYSCYPSPWVATDQGWSLSPTEDVSNLPTPGAQFRYRFINTYSGMCLEVEGGSDNFNARVQQAPCNGSPQQYWVVKV